MPFAIFSVDINLSVVYSVHQNETIRKIILLERDGE